MTPVRNEAPAQAPATIELRLPALPESIALARLALSGAAAVARMSPSDLADLKLAVSEACTNVVVHAYPDGRERGEIAVRYTVRDDELTVEIRDTGVGFDPAAVSMAPDRHASEAQMGLAIASAVTDELRIESGPSGTRVVLGKRRGD
jgi:anti-sigma regulatory factor (Ser/Thr protein kinase)